MTKADELNALADRCEREEGSSLLDADIFEAATGSRDFNKADKSFRERGALLLLGEDDRLNWVYSPRYTTSLDAAVTLVPEENGRRWFWRVGESSLYKGWAHLNRLHPDHCDRKDEASAHASSPALALCAAALRAKAALSHPDPAPMRSERSERATSLLPAKEGE